MAFAIRSGTSWPRDLCAALVESNSTGNDWGELVGPTKERGGPAGIIVKDGYIATEVGDIERVDMT